MVDVMAEDHGELVKKYLRKAMIDSDPIVAKPPIDPIGSNDCSTMKIHDTKGIVEPSLHTRLSGESDHPIIGKPPPDPVLSARLAAARRLSRIERELD
jgi:hypothetical protein